LRSHRQRTPSQEAPRRDPRAPERSCGPVRSPRRRVRTPEPGLAGQRQRRSPGPARRVLQALPRAESRRPLRPQEAALEHAQAHDTASLEIALLRAANIPARYQYGTIELSAEQAQNWVGGVTVPQAAQQLMGQGGIANRGIASGGKIAKIQLEHVWVSAFVNW